MQIFLDYMTVFITEDSISNLCVLRKSTNKIIEPTVNVVDVNNK